MKGTRLIRELLLSLLAYLLSLVAMYAVDIVAILANGLLIIKSFAASFDMNVDIALPRITLDITLSLPSWIHWYPRICRNVVNAFQRLFSHFSFQTIALKNMNVTCSGAQAPGEVGKGSSSVEREREKGRQGSDRVRRLTGMEMAGIGRLNEEMCVGCLVLCVCSYDRYLAT